MTSDARRAALRRLGALACMPALVAPGLAGCAGVAAVQTTALRHQPPADLPRRVEWDAVPFHPQTPWHCAPAALATVLQHAGLPGTPDQLASQVFLPARQGSLAIEVAAGARRQGAVATPLAPQLADLLREVAAGHPVLLLQNLALAWWPQWHYAVLVGYDLDRGEAWLRSGTQRRQALALDTLELTWRRAGSWAITVLPPGQLNATASEPQALRAAVDFERTAPADAAARHFQALLQRWPDSFGAAFGLGNALVRAGQWAPATAVFRQAAQRHDHAAAWNNLALALWQQGEHEAARDALAQAQRCVAAGQVAWSAAVAATAAEWAALPGPNGSER